MYREKNVSNLRVFLLLAVARLRRRRRLLRLLLRVRMMVVMHDVVVVVVVVVVHVHFVCVAVGWRARRDLTRQSIQRLKHFHRNPPCDRFSVPPSLSLVYPWGRQDYSTFPVWRYQPSNTNYYTRANQPTDYGYTNWTFIKKTHFSYSPFSLFEQFHRIINCTVTNYFLFFSFFFWILDTESIHCSRDTVALIQTPICL